MAPVDTEAAVRDIPIIDLSDFDGRKEQIAAQLDYAAKEIGFFYVKGHGIPSEDIQRWFAAGERLLALPDDVKDKYKWIPDRYLGWRSRPDLESVTGNSLWEWFSFGRYGIGGYDFDKKEFLGSRWPDELGKEFEHLTLDLQARTHAVSLQILQALANALGRDAIEFIEPFDFNSQENPTFMAWNWYPPVDPKSTDLPPRLHAHADSSVITLLYQRPGDTGLEIAPGKDVDADPELSKLGNAWNAVPNAKRWTPLDPIEGAITVNVGDGLQYLSDGRYKSTYHRVRAPGQEDNKGGRLSLPYFLQGKLSHTFTSPEQKYPPWTGFEMIAKTGRAYEARKADTQKSWQKQAYTKAYDHERQDNPRVLATAVTA